MTKAVNELRLKCSPLRSHLAAGWTSVFSLGAIKAPRQRSSPFFPEVHTSSWYYGMPPLISHPSFCFSCSHIRWRCWRKRIRAPACSGWVCGRTSLPAHSYRMEGEGEPAVQATQSHICTRWKRSSTASTLLSLAVLQVFQAKMLGNEEAGLDSASFRDLRSATDLALRATATAPEDRRDRGRSRSAWCYPFPKRQGSRPKIALDPAPQKSSWTARQKEEGPESHYIYIYAFSRRFYPKRLTVHSGYTFVLSVHVFPGNRTHNLCAANAML